MLPSFPPKFLPWFLFLGSQVFAAEPIVMVPVGEPAITLASGSGLAVSVQMQGGADSAQRGVKWTLLGPGRILPSLHGPVAGAPGVEQFNCTYRPPRTGGVTATIEATSTSDATVRTIFTITVNDLHPEPLPDTVDLMPLLSHSGEDYHQGGCTNCYAWAANTALEGALATRFGIRDRLSVQYFNQIFPRQPHSGPRAPDPCTHQHHNTVYEAYLHEGKLIPWSNPHGAFALGSSRPVGLSPFYRVLSIQSAPIDLGLLSKEDAIAEIKDRLRQQDFVIFLRNAHYTVLAGYDAKDPDPAKHYWKVLDSLHPSSGGSDPTWHLPMRSPGLNYDPNVDALSPSHFHYVSDLDIDLPPPGAPTCEVAGARLQGGKLRLQPGEALELEAAAEGRPPMTYQWFRNGVDLPGRTRSVLELPAVVLDDAGAYGVRVTSGGRTTSSAPAQVEVAVAQNPSSLTVAPGDVTLPAGGDRSLRAHLTGLQDPRVLWSLEGGGSLSASTGNPVTFKAPLQPGSCTVLAQSAQNPTLAFEVPIHVKSLDINGDGHLDVLDLAALAQALGSAKGDARYLEAADFTGNGRVDQEDVLEFLKAWDAHR